MVNMINIPESLQPFVDFAEGEIISVNLPPELKKDFEQFKKNIQEQRESDHLADF